MWFLLANIEFMAFWKSMVEFYGLRLRNGTIGQLAAIIPASVFIIKSSSSYCRRNHVNRLASRSLPHSSVETDYLTILDWLTPRCHCQRAAKKHGLAALSLCRPQFVGQWRQCLFSVIYRLVAIPKNLFVNHEFKVGSESGRCCIIASTSLRLSDTRKKRHWMTRGRYALAQNS